jgi:poly [ADP-ribose] polymerase 6/8
VDVLQLSRKENFGLGSQLKKIAEAFIHEHWKTLSNESWTEEVERQEAHCQTRHSCPASDMTIARLVDMGFSIEMAKEALTLENGDIDSALSLLLTNPECFMPKAPMKFKGDTVVKKTEVPAVFDGISPYLPSGKDAKVVPSMEGGFLVQVIKYLLQRIPTLNEFCVICDKPHVFQNGAMLKPSVCSRELCVFGYQQLGVMADATEEIATGAEVVGLLVAMASAAVHSSRKGTIFDPFPTVVHPQNPNEFAFHPQRKDYARVAAALDAIPSMKEFLQNPSFSELKKKIDRQNELSYPLLQWIVSSNRSHIVKLPRSKILKSMKTPHQFLLLSSPPAKESAFRIAKKAHGSTFAFHGSNIENWHSILRNGLLNASGTRYQIHGAAYGSGVYLSPHSSISFSYSQIQSNVQQPKNSSSGAESRFLEGKNLRCIALCEVITSDKLRKSGNIWVMPNQDHVCTRFFFV